MVAACAGAARGSAAARESANDPSGLAGPGPVRDTRTVESVPGPVAATPGARLRDRARGLQVVAFQGLNEVRNCLRVVEPPHGRA